MKEIKYRHFSEDSNKLINVDYIDLLRNGFGIQIGQNSESVRWEYPPYKSQLNQFIDLLDKHGNEIYEGDILRYWIENEEQGDLYTVENTYDLHCQFNHTDRYYRFNAVEIIGNIYENPEY